ncbi:MAG TPA: DUF3300 domain-containing protein [Gammaproteobacteria bacterium]
MKATCFRSGMFISALWCAVLPSWAQESPAPPAAPSAAAAKPAETHSTDTKPAAAKTFSQQDLDTILAPIALYPDALLAQILMASTYPLEVVTAARWVKANPKVTGKALEDAMQKQTWDPAVKSLTAVPKVLEQMNEKLDWTQKLGDAFLAQQKDVMATVQSLRAKANAEGNLKTTEQQVVKTEEEGGQTIYIIESPDPEVIYVPTYNPTVVYGAWWYPYQPYYMYPPHYVYPPGVGFTAGIIVGAAIWGNCNWHGGYVNVHVSHYNSFNRTNINNPNWNHNVDHRQGVAYKDKAVAQQYNRGSNAQAAKSREEFRGRADSGRSDVQGRDRSQYQDSRAQADRTQASQRPSPSQDRSSGSSRSSGFSGADRGASTRAASSRGSASRGGGGGHR